MEELLSVSTSFLKLEYTLNAFNVLFDMNLNTNDEYEKVADEFKAYTNATNLNEEQLRYLGMCLIFVHLIH